MTSGAEVLARAIVQHKRLPELPENVRPQTSEDAYVCQRGVVERLLQHYGGSTIGYKIAYTNEVAQRQLKVDCPFTRIVILSTVADVGGVETANGSVQGVLCCLDD